MNSRFITIISLIALAVASRFLPHPPNFTPITAIALFSGAYLGNKKIALLIPIVAMIISDLILGLHGTILFVYGAFALTVFLGFWIKNKISLSTVIGMGLASSVLFFIITNLGSWWAFYPHTIDGLTSAYTLAIPFFRNSLLGNLIYIPALFGTFELAIRHIPNLQKTR